jgi:hypothetical protein
VQRRVGHLALQDPGVDTVGQPGAHPVRPVLPAHVQPRAQQLGDAAGLQVLGQRADERREGVVAGLPRVAVDVVDPRRAGDERRVRDDPVEPAAGHGRQPRPVAQLDVQRVEGERRPGQGQRAGGDVGGGDRAGVAGGVQRLDPAAGAEVQGGSRGAADGGRGQRHGGGADPGDVVALLPAGVEVRQHPPVRAAVLAVGAQVQRGRPAALRRAQQAGRGGVARGERGQRRGDRRVRLGRPEQQQPDQHAQLAAVRARPVRRLRLAAGERGVRLPAEQRAHAGGGVAGAPQGLAQGGRGGGGKLGQHAPILAAPAAPVPRGVS